MKRDLFFTLNTLAPQRGGLSKAVIKRANAIIQAEPERNITFVTLGIQPALETIQQEMVEAKLIDPRIKVVNVINFWRAKSRKRIRSPQKQLCFHNGKNVIRCSR